MFSGCPTVHRPGDEVYIVDANADPHHIRAHGHQCEPRQQSHRSASHRDGPARSGCSDISTSAALLPDGVLTIDARGAIQSINPTVETLFARPSHRLIGHDLSDLIESAPDLLSRLKLAIHSPASQALCWELDARRADGTTFPIELSANRFGHSCRR